MKHLAIALLTLVTLSSCTQQKITYVDSEELIKEYKVMKEYETVFNKKEADFKAKYDAQVASIQKEYQDFQLKAPKMRQSKAAARNQELTQKYQQLQQMQQAESYQLQQESQAKMSDILTQVTEFVEEYGKKNGYTYILGATKATGNVLYGEEKLNITDVVLKALNKQEVKEDALDKEADKKEATKEKEVKTKEEKESTKK